jgi:hypothetical protein
MEIRKTHFEQVPLERVLRIIAEQNRREGAYPTGVGNQ